MTVQSLLDPTLPALAVTDGVEHALRVLAQSGVQHLPVVSVDGALAALVSEEGLIAEMDSAISIGALPSGDPLRTRPDAHVFEAAQLMLRHNLSTLPVATSDGHYYGLITRAGVLGALARMLSTATPGAIVELDVAPRDYSLARLVYAVEQNEAQVLSVSTEPSADEEGDIRVTLKLNVSDTARIRHILEHYGFKVVRSHAESEDNGDIRRRAEEFLRYLEV